MLLASAPPPVLPETPIRWGHIRAPQSLSGQDPNYIVGETVAQRAETQRWVGDTALGRRPGFMGPCLLGHSAYMDVILEGMQGLRQAFHGHQHVLHHMVLFIELAQSLALGQLQEGDLGRHHPAKEVSEDGVVAKRDDVLKDRDRDGKKEAGPGPQSTRDE